MTGFPAINGSVGLVVSFSSPILPFSPGAPLGHSSMTLIGSEEKQFKAVNKAIHTRPRRRVDFTGLEKPISISVSKQFHLSSPEQLRLMNLQDGLLTYAV